MLLCKLLSMPRGGSPANGSLALDAEHNQSFPSAHCFLAPPHLAQVALPHAATVAPAPSGGDPPSGVVGGRDRADDAEGL